MSDRLGRANLGKSTSNSWGAANESLEEPLKESLAAPASNGTPSRGKAPVQKRHRAKRVGRVWNKRSISLEEPGAGRAMHRRDMRGRRIAHGFPLSFCGDAERKAAKLFPDALPKGYVDEVHLLTRPDGEGMAVLGAHPTQVSGTQRFLLTITLMVPNPVQDIKGLGKVMGVQQGIGTPGKISSEGSVEVTS